MVQIFAITGDPLTDWVAVGWTRFEADAHYRLLSLICRKPLYRIVARPRGRWFEACAD